MRLALEQTVGGRGLNAAVAPLPPSIGGRNRLFTAQGCEVAGGEPLLGDMVVKVRGDASDDAAREAWALGRAPAGVAPRLLGTTHPRRLCAALSAEGRVSDTLLADLPVGGVLVLERKGQSSLDGPVPAEVARAAGALIAALHGKRPASGPPLLTGSSPAGLLRVTARILAGLPKTGALGAGRAGAAAERLFASALKRAEAHVEARLAARDLRRVRALCHGDLRWHNIVVDLPPKPGRTRAVADAAAPRLALVDFEHAGIGDPAADLAFMAVRTPLSDVEELAVLDGWLSARKDPDLLDRYFALKPLAGLLGAAAGALDLALAAQGRRPCVTSGADYFRARREAVQAEIEAALTRLAPTPRRRGKAGPVRLVAPLPRRRPPRVRGIVAVDGTAASGKSVLARAAAEALSVSHWNTGAVYRGLALLALDEGRDPTRPADAEALTRRLLAERPALLENGGLRLGGRDLFEALNVIEVDEVVADWACLPLVRETVGRLLAPYLEKPAVVEGRDVGSVLCPKAVAKVFVDADPKTRAERTQGRLGRKMTVAAVRRINDRRDRLDRSRELAPMIIAPGAVALDTTRGSIDENTQRLLAAARKSGATRRSRR